MSWHIVVPRGLARQVVVELLRLAVAVVGSLLAVPARECVDVPVQLVARLLGSG